MLKYFLLFRIGCSETFLWVYQPSVGAHVFEALQLNVNLFEVTSEHQYVLLYKRYNSLNLNSSLSGPGTLLSCFLRLTEHFREKKTSECVSIETIIAVVRQHFFTICFFFWSNTVFQFLLCKDKVPRTCLFFQQFQLNFVTKFGEKFVVELQYSQFWVMRKKTGIY